MEENKIIKAMRIYLGMSQAEAAHKCGIPLSIYAKYENISGAILNGHFEVVYRILVVMQLNPKKFLQGKYELTEIGRKITPRGTGPINRTLREELKKCRPVILKKGGKSNGS